MRIYSAEGELIGTVADDDSYAVQGAGALGQGKDGKVYAAAQAAVSYTHLGIAPHFPHKFLFCHN